MRCLRRMTNMISNTQLATHICARESTGMAARKITAMRTAAHAHGSIRSSSRVHLAALSCTISPGDTHSPVTTLNEPGYSRVSNVRNQRLDDKIRRHRVASPYIPDSILTLSPCNAMIFGCHYTGRMWRRAKSVYPAATLGSVRYRTKGASHPSGSLEQRPVSLASGLTRYSSALAPSNSSRNRFLSTVPSRAGNISGAFAVVTLTPANTGPGSR